MSQVITYVCVLVLSLALLVYAAHKMVDGLVNLAQMYDIPDTLIAMSVVAIGTSLPEIGSHFTASLGIVSGQLDLEIMSATVIGGNMGASTVQQLLFVGIVFIGLQKQVYKSRFFVDTYLPMLGTFLLIFAVAFDGLVTRLDGFILMSIFVCFLVISYWYRERSIDLEDEIEGSFLFNLAIVIGGLFLVLGSAYLTLTFVEKLVEELALNGSMVGAISIGFAATLPEFSTVIEAIRRDSPYLALGTMFGSNIVNLLVGIGSGAVISTYAVPPSLLLWDLPFKFLIGLLLFFWMYSLNDRQAGRREGFFLVAGYFTYLSIRIVFFS